MNIIKGNASYDINEEKREEQCPDNKEINMSILL
jgi:hypothetical protein